MAAAPEACYAHCRDVVRKADKDRYLSILFAPADRRDHLYALYAFNLEIARVRELVSDALPGEVRLQWWRDALDGKAHGEVQRHPVAAALRHTIERFDISPAPLHQLIEARSCDLYDEPMATLADLEAYARDTSSTLLETSATILDPQPRNSTGVMARHGGIAYAITGLLRALPLHAARGQVFVPEEVLARHGVAPGEILAGRQSRAVLNSLAELRDVARRHLDEAGAACAHDLPPAVVPAFLPLALVRPYLDRMDRPAYDPFGDGHAVPQWRRQWILWRAACCAPRES